jgi:hypothetical protein
LPEIRDQEQIMKALLIRSAIVALLAGTLIAFVNYFLSLGPTHAYEPPISQEEMKQWDELTVGQVEARLKSREVVMTRTQVLVESLKSSYSQKDLAKRSSVGAIVIFGACIFIGSVERHKLFLSGAKRS